MTGWDERRESQQIHATGWVSFLDAAYGTALRSASAALQIMKVLSAEELNKPRTRRLRKKLRAGEFQEFGFEVEFQFLPELGLTFDEALEEWIEFVESKDWAFGGGGNVSGTTIEGFVARAGRGTLKEEDRLLAEQWLSGSKWVKSFQVGPLKDAWHGW